MTPTLTTNFKYPQIDTQVALTLTTNYPHNDKKNYPHSDNKCPHTAHLYKQKKQNMLSQCTIVPIIYTHNENTQKHPQVAFVVYRRYVYSIQF